MDSSILKDNRFEAFSRSFHEDNDEEALKWNAIQNLSSFDRLRKGLLRDSLGVASEVNVQDLTFVQRKNLIERLVQVTEEDNEKFLLKLRNRMDRVGIVLPTIEIRFEDLSVHGEAYVGTQALPSFIKFYLNILEGFLGYLHIFPRRKKRFPIFHNVSGKIKPCRLALLLGPPGSGKTTLLLALAGRLGRDLNLSGKVTFNGHGMNEFVPQRTAAYISQHDIHNGEMTVRETLAFSARCQGVGSRCDMLAELLRREKAANINPDPDVDIFMKAAAREGDEESVVVDYILKVLGLEICADTLVGDEMVRGISGGQKKRLSTGEMLVGPAKAFLMDEISNGLDSSTTFQIVKCLKEYVHILKGTALISLLQPAPETYDLFDDIILLSDGHIVYQGPRENVLQFFESMGFKCPKRKGVADFLQEVTSKKDQQQYWARDNEPYSFVTASNFTKAFKSFHDGQRLDEELAVPFDKKEGLPAALTTKKFGISNIQLLKACFARELLLMKRNAYIYIFQLVQLIIIACISMTLFLRTKMHRDSISDGEIYVGALYYSLLTIIFNATMEFFMIMRKLPVFYKQRDLLFYPAWAYAIPTWIVKVPVSFIEVAVWVLLTYYVIGFDPDVGRLFKHYLILLLVRQMASALFAFVSTVCRNAVLTGIYGAFTLSLLFVLGGVVLSRDYVRNWWKWGYWISPVMYAQNAVLVNEFLGSKWRHVLPNATEPLGVIVLKSRGFFTDAYWYWLGVGATVAYSFLFNFCYTMALTYLNPIVEPQAVVPEKNENVVCGDEATSYIKERKKPIQRKSFSRAGNSGNDLSSQRGMILSFEQHSIVFDNIVYSVDMPQEMKDQGAADDRLVLLKGVSGAFKPGILTALMGISGAGKTTLLDVLAGRKTGGYIEGNISISGYPKKQETFTRICGYCEQNDIHSPYVTVFESLLYSAWLRLPSEVNSNARKNFIDEVMELVELTSLKEALVGLPHVNGLSTEQRKRLTIAVELVANPSIIFMDEPTSGLDARGAGIVMRTVRNTVDTGRTVVCTIHQPGIDIFEAFDELFLLKQGGQEIYVGDLGRNSCHLIEYFQAIEGVNKIKDGYNPATWILEVTNSTQELVLGVDFSEIYRSSELFRRNKALIREMSGPQPGSKDLSFATQYAQSFFSQCITCLWKQSLSYWRNPLYTAMRFSLTAVVSLAFGTILWGLGSKRSSQQDLFNAMGVMYAAVIFVGAQNTTSVLPVVGVERIVFYRERAAGMYSAMPYALAQVMIELPYIFAQAAVYGVLVYSMIGFEWTVVKFLWSLFFMYFAFLNFTLYGMMTVALTPNQNIAAILATAFFGLWNLFSGFIIPYSRIPAWWRWYYWANPVAYSLYGWLVSQYGDVTEMLDTNETVEEFLRNYFGFKHDFLGVVAVVVMGFSVLFTFIFAFAIKVFNFQRR